MARSFQLANGIHIACDTRPGTGRVAVQLQIKSGAAHDALDHSGLTELAVNTTFGGTATRSRSQIAEEIESRGGTIHGAAGRGQVDYSLLTLASEAAHGFEVLADVLRNPVFTAAEMDQEKRALYDILKAQAAKPATRAQQAFIAGAFAGQTAALNVHGSEPTLRPLTTEQLRARHADLLSQPADITISFAGDIDEDTARALAEKYFGDLTATAPGPRPALAFTGGDNRTATDNNQLNVVFGFPAPGGRSADRFAVTMMHEMLAGGMSTPLFQEIREKRGLVYSVHASYTTAGDTGLYYISAGTGRGNAGQLMSVAFDLLGGVARDGFTAEDMAQARVRILRERMAVDEDIQRIAARNAAQIQLHGRLVPVAEFNEKLAAVSMDDVRRVAAGILADGRYALGGVGPLETMPSPADITAMAQKALTGVTVPPAPADLPHAHASFNTVAAHTVLPDAPQMTTLANGAKVISVNRPGLLACGAWVGVGADFEPENINGASHMIEHMMFKGTPSYGPGVIDRAIEGRMGGALNAYTSFDRTCYYFYNLDGADMPEIVNICSEMVFKANLEHAEFDGHVVGGVKQKGERDVVLEEIKRAQDSLGNRHWYLLNATAYPGQSHGRTILGPAETIAKMTVAEMAAYRDTFYVPSNVIYCAVGPVDHADFVRAVETATAGLAPGAPATLPTPVYHGGVAFLESDQAQICDVSLATEGVSAADPAGPAFEALSNIIANGESSRLMETCVQQKELTSHVSAYSYSLKNAGLFMIDASVEPENIKPVLREFYAGLRDAAAHISAEELAKAKAQMEMSVLKTYQGANDACDAYACNAQNAERLVTRDELLADIRALTTDDIRAAARRLLQSPPCMTMVHPPGVAAHLLPTEAEILAMRDAAPAKKVAARQPRR